MTSFLKEGYSENGTDVKANEIYLVKREPLAENKEHSPTVHKKHKIRASTHDAGYHRNLAVNRLTPGIK